MSVIVYCHEMCGGDSRLNNLDEVFTSFCRSPLHTAVIQGDTRLAEKIISKRPDLALKEDRLGFTPLHLASARTSLPMVKLLLKAKPEACMVRDKEGKTPLHLAAAKDRVEIMKLLMVQRPGAINLKNDQNGETILHFCVKSNSSVETLEILVNKLALAPSDPDTISIDSKDGDGNTVLHLAAEMREFKIINYLLQSNNARINIDAVNNKGQKALDMLSQAERNDLETGLYGHTKLDETLSENKDHNKQVSSSIKSPKKRDHKERVDALLVVATLIAGIAFQAALNPPGGVWQDDSKISSGEDPVKYAYYLGHMFGSYVSGNLSDYLLKYIPPSANASSFIYELIGNSYLDDTRSNSTINGLVFEDYTGAVVSAYNSTSSDFFPYLIRYAGSPIMAYQKPGVYVNYMLTNTMAFSLSLTIVFAVICGFVHDKSVAQNRVLVMLMCISIGCISWSYFVILDTLVPDYFISDEASFSVSIYFLLCSICGIGLLLWNVISRMLKIYKMYRTPLTYLKGLFSMDASAAGKLVLLAIGIYMLVRFVNRYGT